MGFANTDGGYTSYNLSEGSRTDHYRNYDGSYDSYTRDSDGNISVSLGFANDPLGYEDGRSQDDYRLGN